MVNNEIPINRIIINVSKTLTWSFDYNFICALFFIPVTAYATVKIRGVRIARKKRLERELKLKELERLYRILKVAGSSLSSLVLIKILMLRAGSDSDLVVTLGVPDCIDLETPSYVNDDRILRFMNEKLARFAIKGVIYITKEAFCYLVLKEGLVDFPVVFLERIRIDGIYSFTKTASKWAVGALGFALGVGGVVAPHLAVVYFGFAWLHIDSIEILRPRVTDVNKITGKYMPRIETRKDGIVFDAQKDPLPPVMEQSIRPIETTPFGTRFEITEDKLVDVSVVTGLNNKLSDRTFTRPNRKTKKSGKVVYFSDMVKKWQEEETDLEPTSIIDKMLEEGIL